MKIASVLGILASLCLIGGAQADIRVPPEKREPVRITSKVSIKHGVIRGAGRDVAAKIIIPASLVHPAEPVPPPNKQGALPGNLGTMIAGIALSLAAVSLVFVIRGRRTTRTAAATILGGAVLLGAFGAVYANAPAPNRPEPPVAQQIVIELVEEGDSVTLLLAK
ncbi:MAG TPA: hypothetical protein VFV87_02130 [Pirellulaceae bacterium]|nr:hypothetical protein [Pirellulaceae bacterium]